MEVEMKKLLSRKKRIRRNFCAIQAKLDKNRVQMEVRRVFEMCYSKLNVDMFNSLKRISDESLQEEYMLQQDLIVDKLRKILLSELGYQLA